LLAARCRGGSCRPWSSTAPRYADEFCVCSTIFKLGARESSVLGAFYLDKDFTYLRRGSQGARERRLMKGLDLSTAPPVRGHSRVFAGRVLPPPAIVGIFFFPMAASRKGVRRFGDGVGPKSGPGVRRGCASGAERFGGLAHGRDADAFCRAFEALGNELLRQREAEARNVVPTSRAIPARTGWMDLWAGRADGE